MYCVSIQPVGSKNNVEGSVMHSWFALFGQSEIKVIGN